MTATDDIALSQDHVDYRWALVDEIVLMLKDCYSLPDQAIQLVMSTNA